MNIKRKTLYVETTIPSYAAAKDSRDIVKLSRQIITRTFWETERRMFRLFISLDTLAECADGDSEAAQRRLNFIKDIEVLQRTSEVERLAAIYQTELEIPDRAKTDCLHIAYCVVFQIDFLLSWNYAHFGPLAQMKLKDYNGRNGLWTPILVNPETIASYWEENL